MLMGVCELNVFNVRAGLDGVCGVVASVRAGLLGMCDAADGVRGGQVGVCGVVARMRAVLACGSAAIGSRGSPALDGGCGVVSNVRVVCLCLVRPLVV